MNHIERRAKTEGKTLQERLREHFGAKAVASTVGIETPKKKRCLLLDYSASMNDSAGTGQTRTWELMRAVREFPVERMFAFSDTCVECSLADLPRFGMWGTRMDVAFETIKAAGVVHAVLVTDGRPDSASKALKAANGLRLDIIYVGPPPVPDFLRELAGATGGKFDVSDFKMQGQLTTQIKGLLAGS